MKHVIRVNDKKRKLLLMLPVLVIPFLTMGFYAMGGGKGNATMAADSSGLNLQLPSSGIDEDDFSDKLDFYNKADKDSQQMQEWQRNDPFFKQRADSLPPGTPSVEELTQSNLSRYSGQLNLSPYDNRRSNTEDELLKKLAILQQQLNSPATATTSSSGYSDYSPGKGSSGELSAELDRLQEMMGQVSGNGDPEDPEVRQLSSMMDKILDIQHPERVKQRSTPAKGPVYAVRKSPGKDTVMNGFYSMNDTVAELPNTGAIEAVVHGNQELVNGSVIRFRLLSDVFVKGVQIPAGTYVAGTASINNERLEVEISSIRSGKQIFNVKLDVYDMDGVSGIYIPGAITRDAARQSTENSLQLLDLNAADQSLKAQAASSGLSAIRNLVSKKVKLVKVTVKSGYKVLFKNKEV